MSSSLNRVRYAGLDFDTIEDEIRARLQVKFASSFNDFSVSSLGIVLLDYVSFGLDTLSFYLDRRATDMYLATARTRRSVALLTRQLGYKMYGAVSASVDVNIACKKAYPFPVPIPKGFKLKTDTNIIYEVAQGVTIPAGSTVAVSVPCYQGETVTETFTSDGSADQIFNLTRAPANHEISQGSVEVLVNGAAFSEVDLLEYGATDQFEIGYNDVPPTLRFGDSVSGNIPTKGATISVTYLATLGEDGTVISGAISKPVSALVVSFQSIDLLISNPLSAIGGSNVEDLSHAKAFAPKVYKSRRVAVTRSDYEALAGSYVDAAFGRVAVAQAVPARSSSSDAALQGYLSDLNSTVATASATIQAALSTADTGAIAEAEEAVTALANIQGDVTTLLTQLNSLSTDLSTMLTAARGVKNNSQEIRTNYTDAHTEALVAKSNVNSLRAIVAGLTVAGSTQVTASDQATWLALLDGYTTSYSKIDAAMTLIDTLALTAGNSGDQIASLVESNQSRLDSNVGLDTTDPDNVIGDINTQLGVATTALGTTTAPYSGLYLQLQTMLVNADLNSTSVAESVAGISAHVDKIHSSDCQANAIIVPILARDSSGFYAAPSTGLVRSLQAYLDSIKDVTHSVHVTSGESALVPACIRVRLGIKLGIAEQVVTAAADAIVEGLLRDRSFGASLYTSDLVDRLITISGVSFVNVEIMGYRPSGSTVVLTSKNDSDGNLIIQDSEVITLSTDDLVVTTEVITTLN